MDSCPTSLGPVLWRVLHEQCSGDSEALLAATIDSHPGGWSSLARGKLEWCRCHRQDGALDPRRELSSVSDGPAGYRGEVDPVWVYVFAETHLTVLVAIGDPIEHNFQVAGSFPTYEAEPDWWSLRGCEGCDIAYARRVQRQMDGPAKSRAKT